MVKVFLLSLYFFTPSHRPYKLSILLLSAMSLYSLPTLGRISREKLSTLLLSPTSAPSLTIIDVRDGDHVGGHIAGSTHVPSSSLDYRMPELIRKLADKDIVVFHCALSQQRGPSAALRYLRERGSGGNGTPEEAVNRQSVQGENANDEGGDEEVVKDVGVEGEPAKERESAVLKDAEPNVQCGRKNCGQEVYVLDGGFVKWQEL